MRPSGSPIGRIKIPTDQLVTSFSSKSELALNLSTNGQDLTFMDYIAPPRALDVSNSNTPGVIDPTNPVPGAYYRAVAQLDRSGAFHVTETNAYSGNNGRAAILNNAAGVYYMAGNAGNGSNPEPDGVILGAGAQILKPQFIPPADQSPGPPTPVGSFSITQLGDGRTVSRPAVPDRPEPGDQAAVGAGHRRPSQHCRSCQPRREGDDLRRHLDGQRQRGPGRRPQPGGQDHR
ncbi:MAG: hypothetical protein ACR2LV_09215 [Solirubrobacteraceae bacterium]